MKILFVNHKEEKCGVHQYGKRVYSILKKDTRLIIDYLTVESVQPLVEKINQSKPNFIVYNWHPATLPFINTNITNSFIGVKQIYLVHENILPKHLKNDAFIWVDLMEDMDSKTFSLPRPIFDFNKEKKKNAIPIIGSFGFGFMNKGFDRICKLVNNNLDEAIIHLHITNAFFGDANGIISKQTIELCKKSITKPKIELKITTNFISDKEILDFLNNNTLNMFLYDELKGRGLSSAIDYAVSVNTPFLINNSTMFRHVLKHKPNLSIENTKFNIDIDKKMEETIFFRNLWSNQNLINKFYDILNKIK